MRCVHFLFSFIYVAAENQRTSTFFFVSTEEKENMLSKRPKSTNTFASRRRPDLFIFLINRSLITNCKKTLCMWRSTAKWIIFIRLSHNMNETKTMKKKKNVKSFVRFFFRLRRRKAKAYIIRDRRAVGFFPTRFSVRLTINATNFERIVERNLPYPHRRRHHHRGAIGQPHDWNERDYWRHRWLRVDFRVLRCYCPRNGSSCSPRRHNGWPFPAPYPCDCYSFFVLVAPLCKVITINWNGLIECTTAERDSFYIDERRRTRCFSLSLVCAHCRESLECDRSLKSWQTSSKHFVREHRTHSERKIPVMSQNIGKYHRCTMTQRMISIFSISRQHSTHWSHHR